jgi:hypothetical protein
MSELHRDVKTGVAMSERTTTNDIDSIDHVLTHVDLIDSLEVKRSRLDRNEVMTYTTRFNQHMRESFFQSLGNWSKSIW